ncbi:MAG: hypothetical protein MJZ43_05685 [Bacteroidaceae bacterium]|nr:hypothetical protein [Bacteroidaceae bacterium]
MKHLLTLALALSVAGVASAGNPYITFRQQDGTERSLPLIGLQMTFGDGQMRAAGADEAFTLDLSTLHSMYFADQPTGIENAPAAPAGNAPARFYDLQGRPLNALGGQEKGVYIVKDGQEARKELKQ